MKKNTMKKFMKKFEYYFEAFTFMVLMPIALASPLFLLIWWAIVTYFLT